MDKVFTKAESSVDSGADGGKEAGEDGREPAVEFLAFFLLSLTNEASPSDMMKMRQGLFYKEREGGTLSGQLRTLRGRECDLD
jgi:hypothetical protein